MAEDVGRTPAPATVDARGAAATLSRGTLDTPLDKTLDVAMQGYKKMTEDLVARPGGGAGIGLEQRYLQEAEGRRAQGASERAQFDKDNPLPKAAKLEQWTQKLPEPDPAKSFGSWASVLGVLAGSLSRQPLTAALNASGMAMQAMRANDIKAYEDAKQTWKDNIDITLKNSEQEYKAYDAAFKKRQSNWAEGDADFRTAAAAAHNVAAMQHASEESRWGHVTALGNALKGLRETRDMMTAQDQLDAAVMARVPRILQAAGIDQGKATPQQVQAAQFRAREDIKVEEVRREAEAKNVGKFPTMAELRSLAVESYRAAHPGATYAEAWRATSGSSNALKPTSAPQDMLAAAGLPPRPEKEAAAIVNAVTAAHDINSLIAESNDPSISFGELSSRSSGLQNWWERNIWGKSEDSPVDEASLKTAIDKIPGPAADADTSKLSPSDKNAVFYKKAIYTILEAERQARGGGVLPVAVIKLLTPLLDPKGISKDTFQKVMAERRNDILTRTNETSTNVEKLMQHRFGSRPAGAPTPTLAAEASKRPLNPAEQKASQDSLIAALKARPDQREKILEFARANGVLIPEGM